MTTKPKGRNGGDRATPKTFDASHYTGQAPPIGGFNLAKPSRNRPQKRGGPRGAAMKAHFKDMMVRLAVWGLIPAGFATWLIQRGGLKDA